MSKLPKGFEAVNRMLVVDRENNVEVVSPAGVIVKQSGQVDTAIVRAIAGDALTIAKVGDRVILSQYAGIKLRVDGDELEFVSDTEVWGVMDGDQK